MASSQRFVGKKMCVTGGTRGIGRAIVERLLSEGAFVCFSARKEASVAAAVAELAAVHGTDRVVGVVSHLGRADSRVLLVERAAELWGEIHGLVLNAAVSPPITGVLEAEERGFEKVLATNVTANAMLVQAAAPHFAVGGDAAVVLISSISAYVPAFPHPVYGISKTAVHGLAKALAAELGGDGVRVNVVSPGVVKTSFSRMIWEDEGVADSVSRQTLLGRLGEPEDVAGVVAFLLSKDAAYITAECITVAGGMQSRL